jgi:multimeric flavodoxin WrbA
MKGLIINCTLKRSPEVSNTAALADIVAEELERLGVTVSSTRAVDLDIPAGVKTRQCADDPWPAVHETILDSEILVIASPTWLGRPSSVAQRVLERMDAMLTEKDDSGRPVAYGRVAGVVVTGNEDGAHHVVSEVSGALVDIGYTIPGQSWTYWHLGPGPGPDYLDDERGHEWSARTARAMAGNLFAAAKALRENPLPAPPGS